MCVNVQHLKQFHQVTAGRCVFVGQAWQANAAGAPEPLYPPGFAMRQRQFYGPQSCREQSLAQGRVSHGNSGFIKAHGSQRERGSTSHPADEEMGFQAGRLTFPIFLNNQWQNLSLDSDNPGPDSKPQSGTGAKVVYLVIFIYYAFFIKF